MGVAPERRWRWWKPLAFLALAFCAWILTLYIEIGKESGGDELQHADAIVVFGAAQYAGHPSPVFKSRLDHALELYRQGFAPIVITTGGHASDERFSEGGVGSHYLQAQGIPENALIAETQASDTSQSARRVAAILRENGLHDCIAVSDSYHLFRIRRMLQREGIATFGTPRREIKSMPAYKRYLVRLREALSYTAWLAHLT